MTIQHKNTYFNVELKNKFYQINFSTDHVAVIAHTNQNELVIVKAKRPILKKSIYEFPSGNPLNLKEKFVNCAARELYEETGIKIKNKKRFKKYSKVNPMPARTKNNIHFYSIKITKKEYLTRQIHDDEIDEVKLVSLESLIKKIKQGNFFVTSHIALFLFFLLDKNIINYKKSK
ncbi:MAG: hypothetical protein CMB83_01275 [Flammeovirgaceae bacterium]|nr:hypothetical protein [Flammeovirgaceae bacterium]|tara:strand:+ start:14 stop:538 length:525 start_codon:yes stop_codon:yes gene_type:complete